MNFLYLLPGHSQDGAVHVHVFLAGELGMKTGAHFQQARHPAPHSYFTLGGVGYLGENFKQRGLSGAVRSYYTQDFSFLDIERNILERPEVLTI